MVIENYRRSPICSDEIRERYEVTHEHHNRPNMKSYIEWNVERELSPLLSVTRVSIKTTILGRKSFLMVQSLDFSCVFNAKLIALIEGSFICMWLYAEYYFRECICVCVHNQTDCRSHSFLVPDAFNAHLSNQSGIAQWNLMKVNDDRNWK